MRALATKAQDISLVVDRQGRVSYVSSSSSEALILGFGNALVVPDLPAIHVEDREVVRRQTLQICAAPAGTSVVSTYRSLSKAGTWRWIEQIATNCFDHPEIGGLVLNMRDVTQRVQAEQDLRRSETRYRLMAETAQEGIWLSDPEGRTLYVNRKMAELLGHPVSDLYERRSEEIIEAGRRSNLRETTLMQSESGAETYELLYPHPRGGERTLQVSVAPFNEDDGTPIGSLAMVADVSEIRSAQEDLLRQALQDSLTGLPNRALLLDRLQHALNRQKRVSKPIAILLIDLDQFKLINDSLGHASGDALLVALSLRIANAIRAGDTVARMGGDEFVVLCPDSDELEACRVAARLLVDLCQPVKLAGRTVSVSASIGVGIGLPASPPEDAEALLGQADAAMYEAKARGRAQFAVFDVALAAQARHDLDLSNDLRLALGSGDLTLYYQPVIDLRSGRLLGVEALLRWIHPEHGFISPADFIPVAEQSGLIADLDRRVLNDACRDAAAMRASGVLPDDAYLAINISARNLGHGGIEDTVRSAAAQAGLPYEVLILEVTESGIMDDPEKARSLLEELHQLGVTVAIDDFGTGYSSLAYLRNFPVSALKIDRSFVAKITQDDDDLAIIAAIVDLARALNLYVVAEGIETADELQLLSALGCQAGQGYLWSPAIPPGQLASLLAALPDGRFATTELPEITRS
jgi:diguanylate cyclase (GGDEF)-like protein/PAS domain S-box-containing protein